MTIIGDRRFELGPRRGRYLDLSAGDLPPVEDGVVQHLEDYDLIYRTLCAILYNFVPTSGHPGGSISSGRIVAGLLLSAMDYRFGDPEAPDADIISYAAGHKAMGLYAMWALRNECVRVARPDLLPETVHQLRLEDLLGFRRNQTQDTPLFKKYSARALDGHPTPHTPFVKLATGASGVGVPASIGLGFGAMDTWTPDPPAVHILEGEGGMTAGRVAEGMAAAATARLWNVKLHVDWNQASIDSNRVCRENGQPGDYVQWTPAEYCYLHDWNVISVPDGSDFRQVLAAQQLANERPNDQPTAVIYRTVKGWKYGIEGRKSHGAGHKFLCDGYYHVLAPIEERFGVSFPRCSTSNDPVVIEETFFETLLQIREILENNTPLAEFVADRIEASDKRLVSRKRAQRPNLPDIRVIRTDKVSPDSAPSSCKYAPGSSVTLRAALGNALGHLNQLSGGGILAASADLLDSTSTSKIAEGFDDGFYDAVDNPGARLLALGGICEDGIGGVMAGISSYGQHIGVSSSYAAFIAALQHVTSRLHGIGQHARKLYLGEPFRTFICICAHSGLKTGEDGPTHADPQALQLLQENFPPGIMITLTPWDAPEVYPLLVEALKHQPAVIAPFVTRPNETVLDREALGLAPATAATKGFYALRRAEPDTSRDGTLVLQGSCVTNAFLTEVLPRVDEKGLNLNIFHVSSAELFDLLPVEEQQEIYPPELAAEAMGITGLTMPTMYRWVTSSRGRADSVHAFSSGHYVGSGQAHKVMEEAGLDAEAQWRAILAHVAGGRKVSV